MSNAIEYFEPRILALGGFVVHGNPVGYTVQRNRFGTSRARLESGRATAKEVRVARYREWKDAVRRAFMAERSCHITTNPFHDGAAARRFAWHSVASTLTELDRPLGFSSLPNPLESNATMRLAVHVQAFYPSDARRSDPVNVTKGVVDALFYHAPGGDRWVREVSGWPAFDKAHPRVEVVLELWQFAPTKEEAEEKKRAKRTADARARKLNEDLDAAIERERRPAVRRGVLG